MVLRVRQHNIGYTADGFQVKNTAVVCTYCGNWWPEVVKERICLIITC